MNFSETKSFGQTTEERFHDLFVTAGYTTAFGAAFGAAILGLRKDSALDLQYIYAGASLGFIGGTLFGSYIIFSPVLTADSAGQRPPSLLATVPRARENFFIRPIISAEKRTIEGIAASYSFALF